MWVILVPLGGPKRAHHILVFGSLAALYGFFGDEINSFYCLKFILKMKHNSTCVPKIDVNLVPCNVMDYLTMLVNRTCKCHLLRHMLSGNTLNKAVHVGEKIA